MFKLDTPLNIDLTRFLHWWGGQLSFLVPSRFKEVFGAKRDYLIVKPEADNFELVLYSQQGNRLLGQFALDEAGKQARDQLFQQQPSLQEAEVILRLAAGQALCKRFKLPAAAEENLKQVIAFEMDRQTPFKSDQVYYDVRIVDRISATHQIKVELVVVLREKLDELLEALAGWEMYPDRVDVEQVQSSSDFGHYNLLPEKWRPKKNQWPKILNGGLGFSLGLILLTALLLPLWKDRQLALELEQQVREVGKTAQKVEKLKEEADRLLHETRFLLEKKRTQPVLVDMLNELSQRIPDHTWLNSLRFRDGRLQIQGESPSASALIEILEASPFFENTRFVSPVTQDRTSGLERFQVDTEVKNRRALDQSAHR